MPAAASMPGQIDSPVDPSPHATDVDVSVVMIGRNEGARLLRCLASVQAARWSDVRHELIYVDSRSTDDSVSRAQALGVQVFVLDDPAPCAAKARNLGWVHARGTFILFLDGDTELDPDFVRHALVTLRQPKICAVWGHRRESHPEQSLYTRVLDLDWVYPVGPTLYFGGDVLVRRAALVSVDGFDPTLNAGEEPELCARLRAEGWLIEHIDVPMTRHDLAVTTLRAYWLRAYRSGIAYAEVAERMRLRGDAMWQHEARRDFWHGVLFLCAPLVFLATLRWAPWLALAMVVLGIAYIGRTVVRCRWKAPGQTLLCWQYAVHVYFQKIPALFGQLRWRKAHRQQTAIGLVDYKTAVNDDGPIASNMSLKARIVKVLVPAACLWQWLVIERWLRVWSLARLQGAIGRTVDASNVVLGPVEVHGTGNIVLGTGALIYPGVYLETQGAGRIVIGNDAVLSRGVHIVAFDSVTLADGVMIGEYSSLRDANHRLSAISVRDSGVDMAPIEVKRNVWIGRGVTVLKGVTLGNSCVVAANAVVTRSVEDGSVVGGVPAHVLRSAKTTGAVPQASDSASGGTTSDGLATLSDPI